MAYDPYSQITQDPSQNSTIAKDALNPINWFVAKYKYDPRAWSITKGVWMPYGSKMFGMYGAGISNSFGKTGTIATTYRSERATKGVFRSAAATLKREIGGEFYLGEKMFRTTGAQIKAHKALRKNLVNDVATELTKTNLNKATVQRASKIIGRGLEHELTLAGSVEKLDQATVQKRILGIGDKIGLEDSVWKKIVGERILGDTGAITNAVNKAHAGQFLGKLGETGFKRSARIGLRVGLGIAKVGSGAFALLGLYDLTKMIGEPIGRYIVENANRVATSYARRYAPEMGGQIALGYMSTGAATERQRAVQAISSAYMNGRSAIGSEAQYMHQ